MTVMNEGATASRVRCSRSMCRDQRACTARLQARQRGLAKISSTSSAVVDFQVIGAQLALGYVIEQAEQQVPAVSGEQNLLVFGGRDPHQHVAQTSHRPGVEMRLRFLDADQATPRHLSQLGHHEDELVGAEAFVDDRKTAIGRP
jgi:hypothetical protein